MPPGHGGPLLVGPFSSVSRSDVMIFTTYGAKATHERVHACGRVTVGQDSVEPTFERSEASGASILFLQPHTGDTRYARASCVGSQGSTECRPTTTRWMGGHDGVMETVTLSLWTSRRTKWITGLWVFGSLLVQHSATQVYTPCIP
jgi:hypothetical protein